MDNRAELEKLLEGQYSTRAFFERMNWGESVVNMTPGVEALEWAIAELDRLGKIEAALLDAKKWKRTQAAALKMTAKGDLLIWQVESAAENEREARMLGESADELERILEGKNIV